MPYSLRRAFLSRHPRLLTHRVAQLAVEFSPTHRPPHPGHPSWRSDSSSLSTGFHRTLACARCSHPPSQLTIGPGQFVEPDSAPVPTPFRHSRLRSPSRSSSPLVSVSVTAHHRSRAPSKI
ncbi:hypothetical protein EV363DRAFT_1407170 [Boletus edulis]|nr:hypothetical protein EV363DRAFT_1407170 [Boletus edulis]